MRITRPSPEARVSLEAIDLTEPDLYAYGDAHLAWQTLRAERPVFRQERADGEGFWAVTRRGDVRRVLAEHKTFSSEAGTALAMLGAPDPAAGSMMHSTDPPRHRQLRSQFADCFGARSVPVHRQRISACVSRALRTAVDGEVWDSAAAFGRLPMEVAAAMMGLPDGDVDPLLRLAYASLAPRDPRYLPAVSPGPAAGQGTGSAGYLAHLEIIEYFTELIEERRSRTADDLISHLMSMDLDGRPISDTAVVLNCLSLLLGAVVTTSQVISATMTGLIEQQAGVGRWPAGVPVDGLVEEGLRWSSPVTHFMRRARRDVELHGVTIRAGEAVTAWIASANRDEAVFGQPYRLDPARSPNRHLAFGAGPHLCLGSNLARLMLRVSFGQLRAHIETFELASEPVHLLSNEIAGVVSLPLRVRLRADSPIGAPSHRHAGQVLATNGS